MFDHTVHIFFMCAYVFLLLLERCRLVMKPCWCPELSVSSPHRQGFAPVSPVSPALVCIPAHGTEPSGWMSWGSRTSSQTLRSSQRTEQPTRTHGYIFPVLRAEKKSCLGNTSLGSKHPARKCMKFNAVMCYSSLILDWTHSLVLIQWMNREQNVPRLLMALRIVLFFLFYYLKSVLLSHS